MKNSILFVFLLLVTLITNAQNPNVSFEETFPQSKKINIISGNSDIIVRTHVSDDILIRYLIVQDNNYLKIGKEELLEKIGGKKRISVDQTLDELFIVVEDLQRDGFDQSAEAILIHFEIFVPQNTSLELKTRDGDVSIFNLSSTILAQTIDGNIFLEGLSGEISAETIDGDIEVVSLPPGGAMKLKSTDGDISMALNRTGVDIMAEAMNIQLPKENFSLKKNKTVFVGELNSGGRTVNLFATEGQVRITE